MFGYNCSTEEIYQSRNCVKVLESLSEKGYNLNEKEWKINGLMFKYDVSADCIELKVEYEKDFGLKIYNSFSGSWSTQYFYLNKWAEEYLFDYIPSVVSFESNPDKLDIVCSNIIKTIKFLEAPSERFIKIISIYFEYIENKIKWYKEDCEEYY